MSTENGASGFSGAGEGSAAAVAESSASISAQIGTEFNNPSGISELTISRESALAIEAEAAFSGLNESSINSLGDITENPFSLPEYKIDLQFPELAFNPDLYRPVIENLTFTEPAVTEESTAIDPPVESIDADVYVNLDQPAIFDASFSIPNPQNIETPSILPEKPEEIVFSPIISEPNSGTRQNPNLIPSEETANESALQDALKSLHALELPEAEEQMCTEKLQKVTEEAGPQPEPAASLAYELTFGEVESSASENSQATPQVEERILRTIDDVESVHTQEEEEVEVADEDLKKKIVQIPDSYWKRYEINKSNRVAGDVQARLKEVAQKAVNSATNSDGELDVSMLRNGVSQLDRQTADEKLRIAEGTLQIPEISTQVRTSVDESQTPNQALGEIENVLAKNEARDHLHEITSRQTLQFEKLDKGAQDLIISQRVDKVIRPLIWEAADELPLKNPVEIERSKKAA